MIEVAAATQADLEHMGRVLSYPPGPDMRGVKASIDGVIGGIVGYEQGTNSAVECHIWIGDPRVMAGRTYLRAMFEYAFVQADKRMILTRTPAHNEKSLDLQRRMGFTQIYRIEDGWDVGTDMVLSRMLRDECKWIKERWNGTASTTVG